MWDDLWRTIADILATHIAEGRGHLLTEDVLRFSTAMELQRRGLEPARLIPEYIVPALGGKVDLVIDDPPTAAFEFKFPRDPKKDLGAADTMTMGELAKDFYRIAKLGVADGWVVQVLGNRLRGYLTRRSELTWSLAAEATMRFRPELLTAWPRTASALIPDWAQAMSVEVQCVEAHSFDAWTLAAYKVRTDS
jgi:hypothetical protein